MMYFLGITDIEQAKLHYRKLAKQLHPDAGGTAKEFQDMQAEYKEFLLSLQHEQKVFTPSNSGLSVEKELINELGKIAKVLIKKQVPQDYLRQKMQTTESSIKKSLFADIADWLDRL
nr:hypothetical protein [uncultured Carboxylicivirga sp.]